MVAAPGITPAPTLPAPVAAAVAPRQTTDFGYGYSYDFSSYTYGYGDGCVDGVYSCNNGYLDCLYTSAVTETGTEGLQSCACHYGYDYVTCVFSAMSKSSCWGYDVSSSEWADFERSWFISECGSLPPSIQAKIPPPTSVSLHFVTVDIVTATGSITQPSHVDQPIYKGSGSLLASDCASTEYTLVDEGSTVYWAGFVGCVSDRPECCPWSVGNSQPGTGEPPGNSPATTTDDDDASPTGNTNQIAYPQPADSDQGILKRCADDYISYSGGCCPNGYYPFTRAVGGQTPCWSSMYTETEAPTLTAGLPGQPSDTSKPTSAVINIVWAMQYPVSSGSKKLSTGAVAGIAVGGGIAVIAAGLIAVWWCLRRKRRGTKKTPAAAAATTAPGQVPNQAYAVPGQQGQSPMTQQSPMSITPMSNGGMPPPMGYPLPPPNGMQQQQPPPGYFAPGYDNRSSIGTTQAHPQSPSPLAPQSTGTSVGGGTISEISSQSGQQPLISNGGPGYAPGYPAAIPEESSQQQHQQQSYPPQYGVPTPQGQGQGGPTPGYGGGPTSPQEQFYTPMGSPGQQGGGYYQNISPQHQQQQQQVPTQQQGYFYPNQGQPQQQQQQFYQHPQSPNQQAPAEISSGYDTRPVQEMSGGGQPQWQQSHQ